MSAGADSTPETAAVETKAAGSSFYAAMRVMPKAEREAMYAIYAFCRAVDDIADDGHGTRAERGIRLDTWRHDLETLYAGGPGGNADFLGPHVRRYGMRKADFLAVVDGMEMDVIEDIRGPDLAMLDLYCDRVASAVGRLSIKVFGMDEEAGDRLAHHLGRALQLTNILRDLDEDAGIGRLYLPHELLQEAGIVDRDPDKILSVVRMSITNERGRSCAPDRGDSCARPGSWPRSTGASWPRWRCRAGRRRARACAWAGASSSSFCCATGSCDGRRYGLRDRRRPRRSFGRDSACRRWTTRRSH
jgi:squalene synthase HpnD